MEPNSTPSRWEELDNMTDMTKDEAEELLNGSLLNYFPWIDRVWPSSLTAVLSMWDVDDDEGIESRIKEVLTTDDVKATFSPPPSTVRPIRFQPLSFHSNEPSKVRRTTLLHNVCHNCLWRERQENAITQSAVREARNTAIRHYGDWSRFEEQLRASRNAQELVEMLNSTALRVAEEIEETLVNNEVTEGEVFKPDIPGDSVILAFLQQQRTYRESTSDLQ